MDDSALFRTISRINSVLFLLLVVGALLLLGNLWVQSLVQSELGVVEISEDANNSDVGPTKLVASRIQAVTGHPVQYVELRSPWSGGKLSGYERGEIRNLLFLSSHEEAPRWLFSTNASLVSRVEVLREGDRYDSSSSVVGFVLTVVRKDTNGDGVLSLEDSVELGLASPDGESYKTVEERVVSVIDVSVAKDADVVTVLFQEEVDVVVGEYRLTDFSRVSKQSLASISVRP